VTQKKHLGKVRRIRERLPNLRHVIVVDAGAAPLQEREAALSLDSEARVETFASYPSEAETPSVCTTPPAPRGGQGRAARALLPHRAVPDGEGVLDLRPDDIYWCNADPGWVTGTSYGIIGPWANGITQVVLDSASTPSAGTPSFRSTASPCGTRPDGDPPADARGYGPRPQVRSHVAAAPSERGRAAERRGRALVARSVRKAFPRYLLAD